MSRKYLNVKIGVEFYDALMTVPCFQNNWKAISPSFYLVQRIAELNDMKKGGAVEFYSGTIADIFQPYTKGGYVVFVSALESLGILDIDHHYRPTNNKQGDCMKYKVTDYGCRLVHAANMDYLKKLFFDPKVRRLNQKSISNRKVMKKSYDNPVLNYIYDGLKNISFDYAAAEQAIGKSVWSDGQKRNVSGILRRFGNKKFDDLEIGEKDGRVHHELVRLKSDARFLLRYDGLPYKACLDIRCCHPTFFSSLFVYPPLSLHYETDNQDISPELAQEHKSWLAFFCNPAIDPKEVIRKACGYEDVEMAKAAMNESLNGSTAYPEYLAWLKSQFPVLYGLWRKSAVEDTGNALARNFEQQLMLHEDLYAYADKVGIVKLMPEHDGLGVFGANDDGELPSKIEAVKNYLRAYSIKQFGVPIVIKTKMVTDWANADLLMEMEHKREELGKDYNKLKPKVSRLQRSYFGSGRDRELGKHLGEALAKEYDLLRRNKGVINYWMEREKRQS